MRLLPALAALTLSLVPVTGCSAGGTTLDRAQVEEQISTQLAAQVGREPDDVSCPEDLAGEEGASMTCLLTDGDTEYDVAVAVTSIEDGQANFSIEVADTAN